MKASVECAQLIQSFEGIKDGDPTTVLLEPYICDAGYATVGWGHVLYDEFNHQISVERYHDARTVLETARAAMLRKFGKPALTKEECVPLLLADIDERDAQLNGLLTDTKTFTQQQFDALLSFLFALGGATLKNSTLLRYANAMPVDPLSTFAAAKQVSFNAGTIKGYTDAFCAYSRINHVWTLGLFRRRWCEASLYINGPGTIDAQIAYAFSQR